MSQISGQDSAEAKAGGQTPETVPVPEPEKAEEPTPQDAPEKTEPEKTEPEKKAPSGKAPPKKSSSKKAPPKKAPPKKAPPKSTGRLLAELLIKVAAAAALVWALFAFVLGLSVHYGNNMYPAVHDGDLLVSFRLQKPYINSVVLYSVNGKTEVGRVIALEGSVVDISENGMLTVNGVSPSEEVFYATYQAENSPITFPYTVESGKVFILNDFRSDTNDSRLFGAIDRKDLKGPMLFTVRRRNF